MSRIYSFLIHFSNDILQRIFSTHSIQNFRSKNARVKSQNKQKEEQEKKFVNER